MVVDRSVIVISGGWVTIIIDVVLQVDVVISVDGIVVLHVVRGIIVVVLQEVIVGAVVCNLVNNKVDPLVT